MTTTADDLQWPDYLAAIVAHLLLVTLFFVLAHNASPPPPPLHAVQVQLITAKAPPKKSVTPQRKVTQKKAVQKRLQPKVKKAKPVPKAVKKVRKQLPKPAPKKKITRKKVQPKVRKPRPKRKLFDADPFAPQVSASNAPEQAKKRTVVPSKPFAQQSTSKLTHGMTSQEINRYIARIQRQVQNRWRVPAKSPLQLHDPEVLLRLNRDGSIEKMVISRSSGDPVMDRSLLKAVAAAAPFDLPPNHFDLFRVNTMTFHPLR